MRRPGYLAQTLESDWDQLQLSPQTIAVEVGGVIDNHYTWLSICNFQKHQRNHTKSDEAEEKNSSHGTALGWKICNSALEGSGNSDCIISDTQGIEEHPRYHAVSAIKSKFQHSSPPPPANPGHLNFWRLDRSNSRPLGPKCCSNALPYRRILSVRCPS